MNTVRISQSVRRKADSGVVNATITKSHNGLERNSQNKSSVANNSFITTKKRTIEYCTSLHLATLTMLPFSSDRSMHEKKT